MAAQALAALTAAAAGRARPAGAGDCVDGVPARWVVQAGDTATVAAVLGACAEHHLSVIARGTGTKLRWGTPPRRCDVLLDAAADPEAVDGADETRIEHAAGDLVVTVAAGVRLADLQATLARAGQRLAVDPVRAGTVGGLVGTGESGPLRLRYGRVRDLVIGVTAVRADGVVAHAGGKVVKNVAGYDLAKLLTGSFGTLAVVTEATFRLHPQPQARAWITATAATPPQIRQLTQIALHSQTDVSAVELDRPPTMTSSDGSVSVLIEGTSAGVPARADQLADELGAPATVTATPPPWWGREPAATLDQASNVAPEAVVSLKLTHELGAIDRLLTGVDAAAGELPVHVRGSAGAGTVSATLTGPAATDPSRVAAFVGALRTRTAEVGGTVLVRDAPPPVKAALDVWGPVPAVELMRAVKQRFDPDALLAPGRFVGGI